MSSYSPLTEFLEARTDDVVRMSFAEIEAVIGRMLPRSAATSRAFWSNNASNNVMTRAWCAAGFRSEQVDLKSRALVFRREKETEKSGFSEAPAAFEVGSKVEHDTLALFGWMKGMITIAPGVDLTEPADPELADLIDARDEPSA